MGSDKQQLSYNGVFLIDTIIANLEKHFTEIIIVTNNKEFFDKRYEDLASNVIITSDLIKELGPAVGLYTGLLASSNEDNMLLACDMPYFNHTYVDFLKSKNYDKALVWKNGRYFEPFFGLYKKYIHKDLLKYINSSRKSLNGFIATLNPTVIGPNDTTNIGNIEKIFTNLNYPADWEAYLKENGFGIN